MKVFSSLVNFVFISLVVSTSDLYSTITSQDDLVWNLLNKPVKFGGKKVVKSVRKLNSYLELVIKLIHESKEEVKNITITLLRKGGPKYLDIMIEEEELKSNFNWTDELLIKLYEEREKTQKLFQFIKLAYKNYFSWFF